MLGFDARTLDLHFLDEVKRNVGVRVAADQVGRFLAFYEVGVFRVGAAGDREAVVASVGGAARRITASSIRAGASFQRFVSG